MKSSVKRMTFIVLFVRRNGDVNEKGGGHVVRLIEVVMHLIECNPRHDLATGWECQMTK